MKSNFFQAAALKKIWVDGTLKNLRWHPIKIWVDFTGYVPFKSILRVQIKRATMAMIQPPFTSSKWNMGEILPFLA